MGPIVELPDAMAVQQAARGDADAFMTLVHRYRAPLIAYIHGKTRVRDEAEDIAQDVFCRAWEHLPRLREPAAFAGWLFRIAGNAVIARSRRPAHASLEIDPVHPTSGEPSLNSSVDVHTAVGKLAEEYRTVVCLRHFTGMSNDEIARVLDIAPGTVRSRLSRAYARLRRSLNHLVEH